MKKLSIILAALLTGLTAVSVFAADPVVDCYVPEKAATVDGIVEDGEWDGATKLTLNISDTSTWTEGGAGIVGSDGYKTYNHTDDDFSTSLSFMCDGTYMYILMTRKDSTMNFATDNSTHRMHPTADLCGSTIPNTAYSTDFSSLLPIRREHLTSVISSWTPTSPPPKT